MYDLSKNFYKRKVIRNAKDVTTITSAGDASMGAAFENMGYVYFHGMCCVECALAYVKTYIGEAGKYVIIVDSDMKLSSISSKSLCGPLPVVWKGNSDEIIKNFNSYGFDVYYSGNPKDRIFVFPQYWDYPIRNYEE